MISAKLKLLAPAKINLFLDVLRRRPDGFHDLSTLFVELALADRLTMEPLSGPGPLLELTVSGQFAEGVPCDVRNLAWRGVNAVCEAANAPSARFRLQIVKHIPHGAGLGGGSSDAATAMLMANALLGSPLSVEQLETLAARIGSDCSFFIRTGPALASGRGDLLRPVPMARPILCLVVKPDFSIPTPEAYGAFRPELLGPLSDEEGAMIWLADPDGPLPVLENSFERALHPRYPQLAAARDELTRHGAFLARLSGSGSASFGLFPLETNLQPIMDALAGRFQLFPTLLVPHTEGTTDRPEGLRIARHTSG